MNVLSLFDGGGVGYQALKELGIKVDKYYASEIDKFAIQISNKNHPNIINLGDVTKWREWNLENIDIVIGGSPCQGFSFAGKQLNFEDPRSKLFFEMVDIIEHYKPKYFFLENVKMKKESEEIITSYMGVEPIEINSNLVSAQNRKRLYWTNIPAVHKPENLNIKLQDILTSGEVNEGIEKSQTLLATLYKENVKSMIKRNKKGLYVKDYENSEFEGYRKLNITECERLQTLPEGYVDNVSKTQGYKVLGNGWTLEIIKHIFKGLI